MKKKVFKLWLVTSVFCLAVFVGLAEGQGTDSGEPEIHNDSNEIKLRKLERNRQQRKQNNVSKWRKIRCGMSMKEAYEILGRPKLVQGGSPECVWFYQNLPLFDAKPHFKFSEGGEEIEVENRYGTVVKKIGMSDVGGIRNGILFFEAKSLDTLIIKKQKKLNARIAKMQEKRDKDIASYRVRRVRYYGGPWEDPPDKGKRLAIARKLIAQKCASSVRKFKDNYIKRQIKPLKDKPRSPEFVLVFFNPPNWARFEDPIKNKMTGQINGDNSQKQNQWRKLKINMTMSQVHKLLGGPARSVINVESSIHYYGNVNDHGTLCCTPDADTEDRLTSWVEPFWPHVTEGSEEISDRKPIVGDILVFKGRVTQHVPMNIILASSLGDSSNHVFILDDVAIHTKETPVVTDEMAAIEISQDHPLINCTDGTLFQIYVVRDGIYQYVNLEDALCTINKYKKAKLASR